VVRDDCVVKQQFPGESRRERIRTERGARIGRASRRFVVPAIRSFDDSRGEIVFERLRGVESLQSLLPESPRAEHLARLAGAALAAIHSEILVEDDEPGVGDAPTDGERVLLHGDFACGNLLYSESRDELAIIDWSVAHWMEERSTHLVGPAAIDLSVFLVSLFYRRPLGPSLIPDPERLGSVFLETYGRLLAGTLRLDDLRGRISGIARRYASWRFEKGGPLHFISYYPSIWRLLRFVRRFRVPSAAEPLRIDGDFREDPEG
jgi:tRNA A-37 threonylcarbamoyl transferase component Bud32